MTPAIDKNTAVSLGMLLVMLPGLWFLFEIKQAVTANAAAIKQMQVTSYTIPMAERDALWEKIGNPDHAVPNPRKPGDFIKLPDHAFSEHSLNQGNSR